MSVFVDHCRREWDRLGVPAAFANEMAADLEADLAEARADGVSPEEVLGNGYFDAECFAASWAIARGVVSVTPRDRNTIRVRSLVLALGALFGAVVAGVGFLILVRPRFSAQAVAATSIRRFNGSPPPILVNPQQILLRRNRECHRPVGVGLADRRAERARGRPLVLASVVASSGRNTTRPEHRDAQFSLKAPRRDRGGSGQRPPQVSRQSTGSPNPRATNAMAASTNSSSATSGSRTRRWAMPRNRTCTILAVWSGDASGSRPTRLSRLEGSPPAPRPLRRRCG